MTLLELLCSLPAETRIGIWNVDGNESCPTPQHYQALRNMPFAKIRNLLRREVMAVIPNGPGLLIKIHDKAKLDRRMLAMEIADSIERKRHHD